MIYRIKQKDAVHPTRKYPTDAGMDVYAYGITVVEPQTFNIVRTGIAVEVPQQHMCLIKPKGSANFLIGGGVIDTGYTGEVLVKVFNVTDKDIIFKHGDPLAQLVLVKIAVREPLQRYVEDESARGATGGIVEQAEASENHILGVGEKCTQLTRQKQSCRNDATAFYQGHPVCDVHDPNLVWHASPGWQKRRARELGYEVPGPRQGTIRIMEKDA